jgi:hypothetical protein
LALKEALGIKATRGNPLTMSKTTVIPRRFQKDEVLKAQRRLTHGCLIVDCRARLRSLSKQGLRVVEEQEVVGWDSDLVDEEGNSSMLEMK